jgi:hypothetical protein
MSNSFRSRSAGLLLVLTALLLPWAGTAATKHVRHHKAHRPHTRAKPAPHPPAPETEADRVRALIAGGARDLAVHVIDRKQARPSISKNDWMKWERLRVRAYKAAGSWKALAARADDLIPGLPETFVNWLVTESAEADLQAGEGADARSLLRRLLWQRGKTRSVDRARWRRLVIRSYLSDDQVDDARTALLRYVQDFPVQGREWTVLRATVLLRTHRDVQAFQALVGADTDSAKLLRLYAALRIHAYKIATVVHQATHLAQSPRLDPTVRRKAWILLAQAARQAGDAQLRALALEHALVLPPHVDILSKFFAISADDLWQAYDRLAEQRGNRDRLLVGNDAPWLREAKAASRKNPVLSRALYAFLATHAASAKVRAESHRRLADSLYDAGGTLAVTALYMSSTRFPSLQSVPTSIRVRLVNEALKVHDIKMAARLMKNFTRPPRGEDADQWVLRRARTLIYAGDPGSAVDLLDSLFKAHKQFSTDFAQRTKQVLFDLQAVDDHKQAVRLLQGLYDRVSDPGLRRELLYWTAQSRSAMKQYEDAAQLYLRCAAAKVPAADKAHKAENYMWIQSARFHAAEALANAGLTDDARNVYAGLLHITVDPALRVRIERKMQELWLKKVATTQSSAPPSAASVSAPTAAQ